MQRGSTGSLFLKKAPHNFNMKNSIKKNHIWAAGGDLFVNYNKKIRKSYNSDFGVFGRKPLRAPRGKRNNMPLTQIPSHPPDATMIPGADSLLAMFPDV